MGLLKKAKKAVKKALKATKKVFNATPAGMFLKSKFVKNLVAGIKEDPMKAVMIAGAAALTGGAASALGAGALATGGAAAAVGATGAASISQGQAQLQKQEKAQDAYDRAVAAENERAYAAQRASLLSMRRNYTQETGVGALRRKKASTSYEQDLLG